VSVNLSDQCPETVRRPEQICVCCVSETCSDVDVDVGITNTVTVAMATASEGRSTTRTGTYHHS